MGSFKLPNFFHFILRPNNIDKRALNAWVDNSRFQVSKVLLEFFNLNFCLLRKRRKTQWQILIY
jgi:hypothetical protein